MKLEYEIYCVSVNCIPTSPPIQKGILSLCTSVRWGHCPHLHCKSFPKIVIQLNYLCVTSSFFNKLQEDIRKFILAWIFPWYIINIFHSYWVYLLSKSWCIFTYFAELPDHCSQCSIYTRPYQNQYKSFYILLCMKQPESSLSAKISMVVGTCNFLPSLWYYRMFEYLPSDITERADLFNNHYFNQFSFEILVLVSL